MPPSVLRGEVMPHRFLGIVFAAAVAPAIASADSTPKPKYPPGWDCSAVPAGSQRQACNRSQLDPPMGRVPETTRTQPNGLVLPQPEPPKLPAGKPSTIPRLPGTIENGN